MNLRLFLPRDAAALAMGADAVAQAVLREAAARGLAIELVRTGSRGMLWLEPLLEIELAGERLGFGPMAPRDAKGLIETLGLVAADLSRQMPPGQALNARQSENPRFLGVVERLPWMARQQRLTFARCGVIDPLSLESYRLQGGFAGLERARAMDGAAIVAAITQSGLRGRGGAGFPTGIKWKTVREAEAAQKYIVCNADEGDSGTFADRMLMEGDPFCLIEGMAIAGLALGATQGFLYIRSEYPHAFAVMTQAIRIAEQAGVLEGFTLEARLGAGAYICGEETALLESLEGRRGLVRAKPPLPALRGLFGQPTLVNNVLSLAAVPFILTAGAQAYADHGSGRSRGTLAIQLGGNVRRGGLIELGFGVTLREVIEVFGGGTRSGRPLRAVQIGGPLGAYVPAHQLDVALDYEALAALGAMLGHGGIVVFDDTVDMAGMAQFAFEFCAAESCGKCTPCRIGAQRGQEAMARVIAGEDRPANLALIEDLCVLMRDASLCAMGGLTPLPVMSALKHFPEDFRRPVAPLAAE